MIQIGTYSKKKEEWGYSISVTVPKARKSGGRMYPYKAKYLGDDMEDIQSDLRKELNISGKIKLVSSSSRGGKIMVV